MPIEHFRMCTYRVAGTMFLEVYKTPNFKRSLTDAIRTHFFQFGFAEKLRAYHYDYLGLTNITLLYPNIYNRFRLAKVEKITE